MKKYKKPIVEVESLNGVSMLMASPEGDILSTPTTGLNNPTKNAPERRVY